MCNNNVVHNHPNGDTADASIVETSTTSAAAAAADDPTMEGVWRHPPLSFSLT